MLILAHRGASADAPENTLPAFLEAVVQGAEGVELDVQVCGSGELVVCHDPELTRLAGVPLRVGQTPYQVLRGLDVGTPSGKGRASIPLLEEVLTALPKGMLVNVELKVDGWDDRGLARRVGALIGARSEEERVLISSFNPACLWRFKREFPKIRCGYLMEPDAPFWLHGRLLAPWLSSHSIHPHHTACTPNHMKRWGRAGLKVACWTVDSPERAVALAALGVTYLITNRPALIRQALVESGRLDAG